MEMVSPDPTPAIRLKAEKEGMQETLENYEAFRIIAQRTNNLQVVDSKEINTHLKRVQRESAKHQRQVEESLRREENVLAAAGLAASAKTYTPVPSDAQAPSHVLGWLPESQVPSTNVAALPLSRPPHTPTQTPNAAREKDDDDEDVIMADSLTTETQPDATETASGDVDELPPWQLFGEEEEFNLSTGRFGDPEVGRYQELSDSHFRVLPSRVAQKQWSVDRQLLPSSLKDVVQAAELEQERRHDAIETEYQRRLQYAKYRKWDRLIDRAQKKQRAEKEAREEAGLRPLPPKKRLAQLLRKGSDREKVPAAVRARYNRSL